MELIKIDQNVEVSICEIQMDQQTEQVFAYELDLGL